MMVGRAVSGMFMHWLSNEGLEAGLWVLSLRWGSAAWIPGCKGLRMVGAYSLFRDLS